MDRLEIQQPSRFRRQLHGTRTGSNYFVKHNGSAPPGGTFLPESFSTAGGGRTWVAVRSPVHWKLKSVDSGSAVDDAV
jgi:hypothetical protein